MLRKTCEECGSSFEVKPYRKDSARFCSRSCKSKALATMCFAHVDKSYMKGNKFRAGLKPTNAFPKGNKPWNDGKKGLHLSPETEFKNGRIAPERLPIGTVTIRVHRDVKRAWVKVSDPDNWDLRARVVWRENNGEIKKGNIIHHKDRDTLNDAIGNLASLTRSEHITEHKG